MSSPYLIWELAKERASYIREIREFFFKKSVIEVETPLLSNGTVTDIHLDAFHTNYQYFSDSTIEHSDLLYLQTSPEFAMKRLLAAGYGSIYQISKAFRKEAFGRFHNPEFTMLEWYRVGFDQKKLITEVSELLTSLLSCGTPEVISYRDAFLKTTTLDPLQVNIDELKAFLLKQGFNDTWISEETEKDILLQYIFSDYVEAYIGKEVPCFIYDFPASQSALAKISKADERVAHRFECYYKGIELANGYDELMDADEQLNRFKKDNIIREKLGKPTMPIDNNFINAMKIGLPACAGVALGVDRLLMIAMQKNTINEVITFGIESA